MAVPIHGQHRRQQLRQRRQRLNSDEPHRGRDEQEHPGPVVGEREDRVHATRPMARCGRPGNAASRLLTSRRLFGRHATADQRVEHRPSPFGQGRQPIVHPRPLAAGLDPTPVTQQGEVARNARLKLFERCHELAHADFPFDGEQGQHAAPRRITQQIDVLPSRIQYSASVIYKQCNRVDLRQTSAGFRPQMVVAIAFRDPMLFHRSALVCILCQVNRWAVGCHNQTYAPIRSGRSIPGSHRC